MRALLLAEVHITIIYAPGVFLEWSFAHLKCEEVLETHDLMLSLLAL
jgi:hypothetical protein